MRGLPLWLTSIVDFEFQIMLVGKKVMVPDFNLKNWPRFRFLVPYLALYFFLISLAGFTFQVQHLS